MSMWWHKKAEELLKGQKILDVRWQEWNPDDDSTDYNNGEVRRDITKWEEILSVGNIYNRLVIYKGTYYHRSKIPGFGNGKEDGRLFQTFFFDT